MPAATARSSTACEVASSEPALCMNDFSSASPNVMPPRQRLDTRTPDDPRFLYFIVVSRREPITGVISAAGALVEVAWLGPSPPTPTGQIHDELCTRGGTRRAEASGVPPRSNAVSSDRPTAMYPTQEAAELAALSLVREDPTLRDQLLHEVVQEDEVTMLRVP